LTSVLVSRSYSASSPGVDLDHPSVARVYDYLLGGTANWAIDRDFARRAREEFPLLPDITLANRMFLKRVVRHLADKRDIRQFLDIGPVVPAAGSTHMVADEIARDCRVVYADSDPVSVAHAEVLLDQEGDPRRHAVINADLHDPDKLWHEAYTTGILDPDQPVAVLMIAVLHVAHPGSDGARTVARYRELLPAGSYLGISHVTDEGVPPELTRRLARLKRLCEEANNPVVCRRHAEIQELFGDFEILEPGMAWTPQWHPEEADPDDPAIPLETPSHAVIWAGVGHKPVTG
jgi:hypothetical protein